MTSTTIPLPDWFTTYRTHQTDAIERITNAFERGVKVVMLDAPTGCLAGDTEILVNRGGKTKRFPISELVEKFNGGGKRTWDPSIPTMVQRAEVAPRWGTAIRLAPLVRAIASGMKITYTLTTDTGRTIRATGDHRFALDGGEMVPLKELRVGSQILVDGGKGNGGSRKDGWYRVAQGLVNHPHRGEWPYRQPIHRLVVEASINELPLSWYLAILRDKDADASTLKFLSPADQVHHVDHDKQNNTLENLEVMSARDHHTQHGLEGAWANVANRVVAESVVSIEEWGEEETYDLTVLNDPHNFIANGFVVENSGKTLIGESVRRELGGSALYTCSTKTLQDQFITDYDYARMVKGRANYPTQLYPAAFFNEPSTKLSCDDCTGMECGLCEGRDSCPYQLAKGRAAGAPVAVLNTAYLLGEGNSPRSEFRGRELVIIDEADLLENSLMGFVEVRVSRRMQQRLKIGRPKKKTVKESWVEWAADVVPKVSAAAAKEHDPKQQRRLQRLLTNLARLHRDLTDDERSDWVYTDYDSDSIVFKPVTVDAMTQDLLWGLGNQFLLMSASLVSGQQMADDLGLEDGEWEVVTVANTFPAENRPVKVVPMGKMTAKEYEENLPRMMLAVKNIIRMHPGENILVHTVSFKLAKDLAAGHPDAILYTSGDQREQALTRFKEEGGLIFAPSLDRGVDLPDDLCTVQVIVKVPYPYLGDKQVEARLYSKGGQLWYTTQTVRTMIQMTGRGVRHDEDTCTTYILDSSFLRLFREAAHLFPGWWTEALDMTASAKRELTRRVA